MSVCMVHTTGLSSHRTQANLKPRQYKVTVKICNKVVCDNVYASGMCVITAEDS